MQAMPIIVSMKSSGEPKVSTSGRTIGIDTRERDGADQRADERAHERRAERARGFAVLRHRMAVDHGRGRQPFAGHAEQDRGDVAGGRGHRVHAEQERERLDRAHLEDERQHQRERRRAADAGQQADHEAERHADQHQAEGVPLEHQRQTLDERVEHLLAFSLRLGVIEMTLQIPTKTGATIMVDERRCQGCVLTLLRRVLQCRRENL